MGTDQIREIKITDEEYPQALREINDAPKVLYVRGSLDSRGLPLIAVVGTRKPTPYGVQATRKLVSDIAPHCVVVSGLAYGTDGLAHETTLDKGGITWAVLGTGIDDASIYPAAHRGLAWKILEKGGALISEQPPGAGPLPYHFPLRNRIIAGLVSKVVVIEAAEKSGALITGKLGLDYNRDVLAVPGSIFSSESRGTNQLISDGARPVLSSSDIIEISPSKVAVDLTDSEAIVYKSLMSGAKTVDELASAANIQPREINAILTMLEMKGLIAADRGAFTVTQ